MEIRHAYKEKLEENYGDFVYHFPSKSHHQLSYLKLEWSGKVKENGLAVKNLTCVKEIKRLF